MRNLLVLGFTTVSLLAQQSPPPTAPTADRVGFPANYETLFQRLYTFDRPDNRTVRTIYGNDPAASVKADTMNYPYGSVLVMESWRALQDAQNVPILDATGRFQKDPAAAPTLFVMRKERGFGEAYGPNRNGEWEYVAYRPDGTYATRPEATASCAVCHLQAGALPDWTFRVRPLYLQNGSGTVVDGVIKDYKFIPGELRVKSGTTVTIYNSDLVEHTITDQTPGGGDTGPMKPGSSISLQFTIKGEFNFRCSIHPTMRGKIVVE